jgi:hypothetical protein
MSRVEELETQVRQLSADEFRAFRDWVAAYDAELWDEQFERDVKTGKLDRLAERALRNYSHL